MGVKYVQDLIFICPSEVYMSPHAVETIKKALFKSLQAEQIT